MGEYFKENIRYYFFVTKLSIPQYVSLPEKDFLKYCPYYNYI